MYERLHHFIDTGEDIQYVMNCTRRFGKTSVLIIIAMEYCLRKKNTIVRFAMPFQKEARTIIRVFMKKLLEDCPDDVRPAWKGQDAYWAFANGSELHIHGVNNHHEDNLRGHEAFLAIVDEAGAVDELKYLTNDVLMPQLLTTGGKFIAASTPPPIPGHYFHNLYLKAKQKGNLSEYTIYDNTSLPTDVINVFMEECGGEHSATWRREYLIEFEVDLDRMITPEFKPHEHVEDFERPLMWKYYEQYVGLDLGVVNDWTHGLFGFYHFEEACLYVENEITSKGADQTTDIIAAMCLDTERDLQYNNVKVRIADNNNPQLIQDMAINHEYYLTTVKKASLTAMVNKLRTWIKQGRIKIHPRCEKLIGCLTRGHWKATSRYGITKLEFGRDDELGHFDGIAALMYMIRHINEHSNPVPITAYAKDTTHYIPPDADTVPGGGTNLQNLAAAWNGRNR